MYIHAARGSSLCLASKRDKHIVAAFIATVFAQDAPRSQPGHLRKIAETMSGLTGQGCAMATETGLGPLFGPPWTGFSSPVPGSMWKAKTLPPRRSTP